MTAPVNSTIRTPDDAGNTGKHIATQQRTEGANAVHFKRVIQERSGLVLGVYGAVTALNSVQAAAQNGTSTGFLWAFMPPASGKAARLRRCTNRHNILGVATMATLPRIVLARFTYTGTPSGAVLSPAKLKTSYPNPVLDLRTASTGATVTLAPTPGSIIAGDLVPIAQVSGTPASFATQSTTDQPLIPLAADEDEWPDIHPGEGIVLYQPDAGTASDTRRFISSLMFDEVDIS